MSIRIDYDFTASILSRPEACVTVPPLSFIVFTLASLRAGAMAVNRARSPSRRA
ncbi:MAG: hypothetical protein WCI75_01710 [candidate division NC10 bacterium]